jgi:hypothetical protein
MNVQRIRPEMAAALVSLLVGTWLGYGLAARAYRNNAIQHECGGYDYKTGEFKWGQGQ